MTGILFLLIIIHIKNIVQNAVVVRCSILSHHHNITIKFKVVCRPIFLVHSMSMSNALFIMLTMQNKCNVLYLFECVIHVIRFTEL